MYFYEHVFKSSADTQRERKQYRKSERFSVNGRGIYGIDPEKSHAEYKYLKSALFEVTIYAPMIYTAPCVMFLMRADT